MKPIVIIKETNKNGKFEFTEEELKELIEKAYNQGVEDGRPKATLPQSQYDRPEDGILYRNINGGENDKLQTLPYIEYNDLVYRGGEHKIMFPKQGEPIPCELNQTSSKPNPNITAWNTTTSKQSNKDTYTLT